MALTDPELFSTQNSAMIPRGVYCTGLAKVFAVWTVQYAASARFVARQHDGAAGSDFFLPVIDNVHLFDVKESDVEDQVIVFYATYFDVKYFVYDFATRTLVSGPTTLTVGEAPALVRGPLDTILLYERLKTMFARLGTGGTEKRLWSTAVQFVDEISAIEKATNPAFYRYHGVHSTRADAALPLRADVNTVFLFDLRDDIT
jgi:hypothetical protein